MKVSFLFWNICKAKGTRFHQSLRQLTNLSIDVFLFAEPPDDDRRLLEALNGGMVGIYYRVPSESSRLVLFTRLPNDSWMDCFTDDPTERFTAHELSLENQPGILLIGVHLRAARAIFY